MKTIRLVIWKDDNKIIDVCPHISLRTAELQTSYEYKSLLVINCKVCDKTYKFTVQI
jgi:hypothetical protein